MEIQKERKKEKRKKFNLYTNIVLLGTCAIMTLGALNPTFKNGMELHRRNKKESIVSECVTLGRCLDLEKRIIPHYDDSEVYKDFEKFERLESFKREFFGKCTTGIMEDKVLYEILKMRSRKCWDFDRSLNILLKPHERNDEVIKKRIKYLCESCPVELIEYPLFLKITGERDKEAEMLISEDLKERVLLYMDIYE